MLEADSLLSELPGKPFPKNRYLLLFRHSIVSDSLWPHRPQHTRLPWPSLSPIVHSNSCPLIQWCHPTISSSVVPFSSCPQSFIALGSFPMSRLFASSSKSIGTSVSSSVLMNIQVYQITMLTLNYLTPLMKESNSSHERQLLVTPGSGEISDSFFLIPSIPWSSNKCRKHKDVQGSYTGSPAQDNFCFPPSIISSQ